MLNGNSLFWRIMNEVFFEDLKPGQIFSSKKIRVDAGEITSFATKYDPQPFHLDEATARNTFSGYAVCSTGHIM